MAKYVIEVEKEMEHIVGWIKDYFVNNGPNSKAVIGMSGGKDSTITAALLVKALGPERVYGVIMPEGEMRDQYLAEEICKYLGITYEIINIDSVMKEFYNIMNILPTNLKVTTNAPARMRMIVLYTVAANIGARVVNTCNRSEDYVGFSTKYGDLAGDFSVLQNYPVRWVKEIGLELVKEGLLEWESWVEKTPDDGMCGQSDEDKFGFTYETLDNYIIDNIIPDYDTYKKIEEMYNRNTHKDAINLPKPEVRTRHKADKEYVEEQMWFRF